MSLNSLELRQVVAELDPGLRGAFLQNVFCPSAELCYLKFRQAGNSTLLCLSVEVGLGRVSVAGERARGGRNPPPLQFILRKALIGARLEKIGVVRDEVRFDFLGRDGRAELVASPRARLIRLIAASNAADSTLGETVPELPTDAKSISRLQPVVGARFPLAGAAEDLFKGKSEVSRAEDRRTTLARKVSTQLARMERTLVKVRNEAARGTTAESHRHFGELLVQNPQAIPRGASSVELPDYSTPTLSRVIVPLDPRRRPQEQAAWHFNQYRRFQRAGQIASQRLAELEKQRADLKQRLVDVSHQPIDSLLAAEPPEEIAVERKTAQRSLPYREYVTKSGERIWVGKGAKKNDDLTFRVARPHNLWLHARGASGAHVVVPVDSEHSEISSDLLIDAAHLALYHSQFKNEARGEVSYTRARNVRRQKGGPPGQVTYTQEKTIMVRIEPDRLARLLRTASTFASE